MRFSFSEANPDQIISKIHETLGDRPLAKIMSFELNKTAGEFLVKFSKVGTTTLRFEVDMHEEGIDLNLAKEKIALAHRPMYSEVKDKMIKVLNKAGATLH